MAGLTYARQHRRVRMHLVSALMLTIFGMPFATLLPAVAAEVFGLSSTGYSALMGTNGAGALVGALAVASLPPDFRRESVIRYGLLVMAVGALALSLTRTLWIALGVLLVLGAAFLACVSSIYTNLPPAVPPAIRGRVMSLFVLSFMGVMPFGALAFGWLGDLITPSRAILTGSVVLIAYALLLVARPGMLEDTSADAA